MKLSEFYGWEVEHVGGNTVRQYEEDGTENPSTLIRPAEVVRASLLPRLPLYQRHDVFLDPEREQRFVRRFGRGIDKKTETNLDAILTLYKYVVVDARAVRIDYSIAPDGSVVPVGGYRPEDVRGVDRLCSMEHALAAMRLNIDSAFTDLLRNLRCDPEAPFYQGLLAKHGAGTRLSTVLLSLGVPLVDARFGYLLDLLGFPRNGSRFEYLHCIETTAYRLWVFSSSGQALVTNPEFQLYL